MGSGSLAAMAVFESGWRPNLDVRDLLQEVIFPIILISLLAGPSLAARRRSHFCRYFQRSRLWLKRRCVRYHSVPYRDAA